jgi:beta-catenin-like protein 1
MSDDEHIASCIKLLFEQLTDQIHRQRLLSKFQENEYEKIERLMELHEKYWNLAKKCEAEIEKMKREIQEEGEEVTEEDEEDFHLHRLENGLFTLQLVDYILATVYSQGDQNVKSKIRELFDQQNRSLDEVKKVLEGLCSFLLFQTTTLSFFPFFFNVHNNRLCFQTGRRKRKTQDF